MQSIANTELLARIKYIMKFAIAHFNYHEYFSSDQSGWCCMWQNVQQWERIIIPDQKQRRQRNLITWPSVSELGKIQFQS